MSNDNASARWLTVHDELLRGIVHGLSNRIATVGAAAYMFEHDDVPVDQALRALREETARLEALLQLLRVLPQSPGAEAEPATANDACKTAVAMHAHHPDLRDMACDIEVDDAVYPIWAEPHSIGHALLVALGTAKRNAVRGGRVTLRVTGNSDRVKFLADAGQPVDANDAMNISDGVAAAWLLAPFGGTARITATGCELEVPTLIAARKARNS